MSNMKVGLIIALAVITATALIFISMITMGLTYGFRGWHMGRGMIGYGWGMMGVGWGSWILMLAFVALIAFGAYLFLSGPKSENEPVALPEVRAIEILKERYAKGEITREEYMRMKEEVQK